MITDLWWTRRALIKDTTATMVAETTMIRVVYLRRGPGLTAGSGGGAAVGAAVGTAAGAGIGALIGAPIGGAAVGAATGISAGCERCRRSLHPSKPAYRARAFKVASVGELSYLTLPQTLFSVETLSRTPVASNSRSLSVSKSSFAQEAESPQPSESSMSDLQRWMAAC
ncbi:MAG: hypothetical protein JST42_05305 [Bacteroidetes bacterium]|nr:hypothetical protein [Bacteroidota bacterium]